jgi:phosphoglycerate kinase
MSEGRRLRSVGDLAVRGRRVFLRADLNVPLRDGVISDDTRIRASRETLDFLRQRGARVVLASHLGRPRGEPRPEYSLRPVAQALGAPLAPDCIGADVEAQVDALGDGDLLLLENLRFHRGEEKNDPDFAAALARLADVYVNDAFGAAHRAHASTAGLPALVSEHAAGFLLEREIAALERVRNEPGHPFVCIIGGAKVSDKLAVLETLAEQADTLIIGGAMAYTFLLARDEPVGRSLVEPDRVETARALLAKCDRILLPRDHVVAAGPDDASEARTVSSIPDDGMGLDIGPETVAEIGERVRLAKTIFWNGPLGLFEKPPFNRGTEAVANHVAASEAFSVVGGGDSVAAVRAAGVADRIDHLSTGGGASLEFIEGRTLPGVEALREKA